MYMDKKKVIYGVVIGAVLCGGIYITTHKSNTNKETQIELKAANPSEKKSDKSSKKSKSKGNEDNLSENEKNFEAAKRLLESTKSANEDEKNDVSGLFKNAVEAIRSGGPTFSVQEVSTKYFLSDTNLVSTLGILVNVNQYEYDESSIIVNTSNSSDVRQFVVRMKKDGEDDVYFVGNYNVILKQMQLLAYKGQVKGATFG